MQNSDTLASLIGKVRNYKPNATPDQIRTWINDAIRDIQDGRIWWSDSIRRGVLSIPDAYATGTVSLATNSAVVTGDSTAWPVSDVVSTTLSGGVVAPGYSEVSPQSMAGITGDSFLVIDGGTPSQEVVPVLKLSATKFGAVFTYAHSSGVTVTASSLSGLQFRISGCPVFTVTGVVSATSMVLDNPWGAAAVTGSSYQILKMYATPMQGFKKWLAVVDQRQGTPLVYNKSQQAINVIDPQRTNTGDPACLAWLGPSQNGNPQYEIWPAPTASRQLSYLCCIQWPELRGASDRPPYFINPEVIVNGATARALRSRLNKEDPFYDMRSAREFQALYEEGKEKAVNADESKAMQELTGLAEGLGMFYGSVVGGAAYWQQHDPDVNAWRF